MEKRTHHYTDAYHWSHPGSCQQVCSDWYQGSQIGECSGRVCEVVRRWKKEAPK